MVKDKKEEEEKSKEDENKKVEKFLGLEKSITTKRENPFTQSSEGTSSAKKMKSEKEEEESIINTSIC